MQQISGRGHQFGTFKGVFTPSILTILGVVMYLRIGWVLGNLGLPLTLLVVTMSSSITLVTALSLSALATNMKIKGGGAYFIISRSLGIEAGAAIGLPLFLAQALGAAFYITGFAEALVDVFPALEIKTVGLLTLLILTVLALISASLALKSQLLVMAAIIISLISFFVGAWLPAPSAASVAEVADPTLTLRPFWLVFAVFFPAVTGIEAGLAMSGDLRNPAKALPHGTLAAVLVGYVVYMLIPLTLAFTARNELGELDRLRLIQDLFIVARVSQWSQAVIVGVWAAALSSAMGAILGAPRTLQAMARDGVMPRLLGHGCGANNEPRAAMIFSFAIVFLGVYKGDLNLIAPILSMFFLTSYGLLNVSAGLEELIAPPSWRPTFKVPWPICLLGSLACFGIMFMINAGATISALAITLGIYWMMKRRKFKARWGDMRQGMLMQFAQYAIYTLGRMPIDERNWKPNLLVLSGNPASRWYLIELASAISRRRGFLTVATIVPESTVPERRRSLEKSIAKHLERKQISSLVKVYRADTPLQGALRLATTYGFGPIAPNTLMLGETEDRENYQDFAALIMAAVCNNLNLTIVREGQEQHPLDSGRRIDVWWGGEQNNMGFMLALAHLLNIGEGWQEAELNLKTIVDSADAVAGMERRLTEFIAKVRLRARPDVAIRTQPDVFAQIREGSQGADLVLLGIRRPEPAEDIATYADYYQKLLRATDGLPPVALCLASEDINFNAIFMESN